MRNRVLVISLFGAAVVAAAYCALPLLAQKLEPSEREPYTYFHGAGTFRDKESGITFYVESDGRHLAALDSKGRILWLRDPFSEGKLEPYRSKHPVIVGMGPPTETMVGKRKGRYLGIVFDSTQAGILSFETGEFTFLGND